MILISKKSPGCDFGRGEEGREAGRRIKLRPKNVVAGFTPACGAGNTIFMNKEEALAKTFTAVQAGINPAATLYNFQTKSRDFG